MRYSYNEHYSIRVQPANPASSNPAQRVDYVIHMIPEGALDKYGNIVSRKSMESHIPFIEYDFQKLIQSVPYDK